MTKQKSKERTIMDNMVQECKNSFQSIKHSSLSEESKNKIIRVLKNERMKRFNEDDYQSILEKVMEESTIPAKDLYEIATTLIDKSDIWRDDLCELWDSFVDEYVNDEIRKKYGKMYIKKMPKTMQDLKKAIVPFEIPDNEFIDFLFLMDDCLPSYTWQELCLWPSYKRLLKDKKEADEGIKERIKTEIKDNEKIKKYNEKICDLSKKIDSCRMANPGKQSIWFCAQMENEIDNIQDELEIEIEKVLHKIKDDVKYDEIIAKIKWYEKLVFHEKYPYLEKLYDNCIIKRNLNIFDDDNFKEELRKKLNSIKIEYK